ncbi:MAG: hypothetical protein AAF441_14285 [Pseudomonadota bacterium]
MSHLEDRISKLEVSMVRWRRAAIGLGLIGVAALTMAASDGVQNVIQAKRILVLNDEGKVAMQLTGGSYGGSLELYNEDEKRVFSLTPGYLQMMNGKNAKTIFTIEQHGLMNLTSSKDGNPILQAGRSDGKYGYIQIQNADGSNTMYGPAWR